MLMKKIPLKAKAKTPKGRRHTQEKLEQISTPIQTIESREKSQGKVKTMPTRELRNVIAQTVLRVFPEEFGQRVDELNAREHYADRITWAMKYGGWNEHGYAKMEPGIPMREKVYKRIPRCKAHRS
jgi:hypothetical protein